MIHRLLYLIYSQTFFIVRSSFKKKKEKFTDFIDTYHKVFTSVIKNSDRRLLIWANIFCTMYFAL